MRTSEACQRWIEGNSLRQRHKGSAKINVRAVEVISAHAISDVEVECLTEEVVSAFAAELLEETYMRGEDKRTYSPEYVCQILSFLRKTVNWLARNNIISPADNPSKTVSRVIAESRTFAGDDEIVRAYTKGQVAEILASIADDQMRLMVLVAVTTGLRKGELLGLQWDDIDWPAGKAQLRRQVQSGKVSTRLKGRKKARHKIITIPPQTLDALRLTTRNKEWIFSTRTGRPMDGRNLSRSWDKVLDGCPSVPRLRWHDLRHTFASLALQAGAPILWVSSELGHHSPSLTWDVYAHLLGDEEISFAHAEFETQPRIKEVA